MPGIGSGRPGAAAQQGGIGLGQRGAGVDAEFVRQPTAAPPVDGDRLVASTDGLVRPDEPGLGVLVQRLRDRGLLQDGQRVGAPARRDHGLAVLGDRPATFLRQRDDHRVRGEEGQVREGRLLPQPERVGEQCGGPLLAAAPPVPSYGHRTRDQVPEAQQVDGVVRDAQRVAVAEPGEQRASGAWWPVGLQQVAQVLDMGLDDVRRGRRRVLAPQRVRESKNGSCCPRDTASRASTARRWGEPRSRRVPSRQAQTGPST